MVTQAANSDDLTEYGVSDISNLMTIPTANDMAPDMQIKCNSPSVSNFTTMDNYFVTDNSKLKNIGDARTVNKISPYSDKDQSELNYSDYP